MNKVSVIIPYYKKKKYILKSIKSVLQQTYKNFEIILVFDEENNKNLKYINNIKKLDKRIKLIVNKKNIGAGKSRNKAIKIANGKYISFLDSDDIWNKYKLEKQIKFLIQKNCKICHSSYEIIDEKNVKIGFRKAKNFYSMDQLLKSCDIGLSTVILEKKILNGTKLFPDIKTKEDFVLWLNILKRGYSILGLNQNLIQWRRSIDSLSSSTFQKLKDGYKVYNFYMGFSVIKSIYLLLCLSLNFLKKNYDI